MTITVVAGLMLAVFSVGVFAWTLIRDRHGAGDLVLEAERLGYGTPRTPRDVGGGAPERAEESRSRVAT